MGTADDERAPRQRPPEQPQHHYGNPPAPRWQERLDPIGLALLAVVVWLVAGLLWRAVLR